MTPAGAHPPLSDAAVEAAALWVVRLSAGDAAEREAARAGLEAWIRQSPENEAAARRMRLVVDRMQDLRGPGAQTAAPARAGFDAAFAHAKGGRAKRLMLSVAAFALMSLAGWAALQAYPVPYLTADIRSATGQWHTQVLEDGTRVTLASGSAANVRFDAQRRVLELVHGEVLVDVAKDAARPFVVRTPEARITALGTRFVVDRRDAQTVLTMIESRVRVDTEGGAAAEVQAGQRVTISAQGIGPVQQVDPREVSDAWKFHQLVARDRPLPDVLDALNRHRPGRIFYDRAALEDIRMAVVLPLDDTDRALQLLAESVPGLTLRTVTPYLVWVGKAPSAPGR
ncbi:FecR family protein [Achromobacter spanius]|uniref:FecR family protein n=1 Tax=Achromobacter spanius TaxID=217203 RepID=UPI0037F3A3FB